MIINVAKKLVYLSCLWFCKSNTLNNFYVKVLPSFCGNWFPRCFISELCLAQSSVMDIIISSPFNLIDTLRAFMKVSITEVVL